MSHATNLPIKTVPQPLHVVAAVSNGRRFRSRYALFRDFAAKMHANPAVELTVVELALGARPYELADAPCTRMVQLRSGHELFHKENLINLGVQRLPEDWRYLAWLDADIDFIRPDWAEETLHQLQHHKVVQPFAKCMDIGPDYLPTRKYPSTDNILWNGFAYSHFKGLPLGYDKPGGYAEFWHPGFGWAIRREAFDAIGGLLDRSCLGAADHIMAWSFLGRPDLGIHGQMNANFKAHCKRWADRAFAAIRGDIGYCEGLLSHHWHGSKSSRRYVERWKVLLDGEFDPDTDLFEDSQGVLQLTDRKPNLRRDIQRYFAQRNEDSIDSDLLPV